MKQTILAYFLYFVFDLYIMFPIRKYELLLREVFDFAIMNEILKAIK